MCLNERSSTKLADDDKLCPSFLDPPSSIMAHTNAKRTHGQTCPYLHRYTENVRRRNEGGTSAREEEGVNDDFSL